MTRRLISISATLSAAAALILLPASLLGQQKPSDPPFRITGIVVNARDSSPVLHCTLTARLAVGGDRGLRDDLLTTTDETGHFALNLPSAGNWELRAHAHNIHSQPLENHEGFFTGVILTSQHPTYEVVFKAVPDAILRGIVTDEAGEPVPRAQVNLFFIDRSATHTGGPSIQQRQGAQTDDLGHYELDALDPGDYMVQVQAVPWYAQSGNPHLQNQSAADGALDPSLDLVYPPTWYPGVQEPSAAGSLPVHAGEVLEADFRLSPVPAAHLLIHASSPPAPPQEPAIGLGSLSRRPNPDFRGLPSAGISLVLPDGTLQRISGQFTFSPAGDLDVGALAPGTYQVALPGGNSLVRIQGAGATIQLAPANPGTPVTITVDGGTQARPTQIALVDTASGQAFSEFSRFRPGQRRQGPPTFRNRIVRDAVTPPGGSGANRGRGNRTQQPARPAQDAPADPEEAILSVPPGKYTVIVGARQDIFVTGLTATGAVAAGHTLTVAEAPVQLAVHLASGLATVDGIATLDAKPRPGAMVLLVPATLGSPSNISVIHRDQTNSDGSFRLDGVIPGQYILLAIDNGWDLRWNDPEVLRPYLMQGTPLDLRPSARATLKLTAILR